MCKALNYITTVCERITCSQLLNRLWNLMSWQPPFVLTEPTDNASVSFVQYKGDYYVSTETNFMHKVNPETLEATEKVGSYDFNSVNLSKQSQTQGLVIDSHQISLLTLTKNMLSDRWTGVNSLLLMEQLLTHMLTLMGPHTTWGILTLLKVSEFGYTIIINFSFFFCLFRWYSTSSVLVIFITMNTFL